MGNFRLSVHALQMNQYTLGCIANGRTLFLDEEFVFLVLIRRDHVLNQNQHLYEHGWPTVHVASELL